MIIPTLEADPCGRATALRSISDQLLIGGAAVEIEFEQGNGTRRRAKYTGANADHLRRAIDEAQAACDKLNGVCVRPRRYAIGGRMS